MFDLSSKNRRLTIIFILICTKRLERNHFGRMCNAIEEFIAELKIYADCKRIDIHVDTLIGADNVEWKDTSPVPINQYEWKEPIYGDNSQYQPSEIFTTLANRIECYEHDKYVPILYLFGRKLKINSANERLNLATSEAWETLQNNQIWRCAVKNSVPLIEVTDFYEKFASSKEHIITNLSPESLKNGIILIPKQIDLISSQYINLFNKHKSIKSINNKLQVDNQRLQSEFQAIKGNYDNIKKELQEANKQVNEWQSASSKWKSSYDIIDKDLSDSKIIADALKEELNSCHERRDELNRKIQSLNKKLQSTLKSNEKLKESLDTSTQTALLVQSELSDLKERNKALSEENERLRGLVAIKNSELAKKEHVIRNFKHQNI